MDPAEHTRNLVKECLLRHKGKQNAVSIQSIMEFVSAYAAWLTVDERGIRQAIEDLRRSDDMGALICSSSGVRGRWLATSLDEVMENYREERRRALEIMVTLRTRRARAMRHFAGQLAMPL